MKAVNKKVVSLYPEFAGTKSLQGLYLDADLLTNAVSSGPCIYANFLTSLDGRIAWRESQDVAYQLPDALKSDEDFRLFLELYAHADCIVTHGGYMRALNQGHLGNVLQIPDLDWTQDIHCWREQQGLAPAPDVVVLSAGLDFPLHQSLYNSAQKVHLCTGANAPAEKLQEWSQQGFSVQHLGSGDNVQAGPLYEFLQQQKYRRVYLVAGPVLLEDLLLHGYVHRFFMTISHQFLGGDDFLTIIPSLKLKAKGHMQLLRLHMGETEAGQPGQWYAEFAPQFKILN